MSYDPYADVSKRQPWYWNIASRSNYCATENI